MSYRLRGDFEKAKTYYLYAFHTAANNEERAMALSSYGTLEMQQERLESAASTLRRALRICEDGEITGKTYVTILNNLGSVAKEQAANDSGVHYLEKASAQAKKSGLSESYLMARVNLADLHRQDGQYSRGHEILDEIETMVKGTWAKDAVQTLRSRLIEEQGASVRMQSKDQQVSALLHLMEQACQDELCCRNSNKSYRLCRIHWTK